ncbi:MAG: hypothetical protein LUF68_00885, partial [Clostridiales bacterium]|nr:hypothetical protein [Clostridiales bacterium]
LLVVTLKSGTVLDQVVGALSVFGVALVFHPLLGTFLPVLPNFGLLLCVVTLGSQVTQLF